MCLTSGMTTDVGGLQRKTPDFPISHLEKARNPVRSLILPRALLATYCLSGLAPTALKFLLVTNFLDGSAAGAIAFFL
jgi:hypothetical protein